MLIATPPFGHPKGVFFLAGGGFVPNTPLTVNMFCPDWTFDAYGNWSWTIKVDGRGTFAGWKLHIPTPILVKGTSCVLRARRGDNPFGAAATFKIVPSDQPLQGRPFRFHIAARVVQHSGQPILLITVDAAPAAEVQLACTCASTTLAHRATQLPWNGHAVLHMPFPPSMRGTVRLMAIARLGNFVQHKSVQLTARALRAR